MMQLRITRAGLGLADLIIESTPGGAFVLDEESNADPDITWRYAYAPLSSDMHGKVLLAAVKEHATLPLQVNVHGTSAADLATNKATLAAAVEQWAFTAQLTVNGEGFAWSCDPSSPKWAPHDSGMAAQHMARATLLIPVYPIGAPA